MKVLIYTLIFILIVASVSLGGMICESEGFAKRAGKMRRRAASALEHIIAALLMPIEAANYIYERCRTR